jgi:hypothetical protein
VLLYNGTKITMERKSKADIKKALEALKGPKGPDDKSVATGGKNQAAKTMTGAVTGKSYRPKI